MGDAAERLDDVVDRGSDGVAEALADLGLGGLDAQHGAAAGVQQADHLEERQRGRAVRAGALAGDASITTLP